MSDKEIYEKVEKIIGTDLKRFIEADGGKISLSHVEDKVVYVKLTGACSRCAAIQYTLKGGVEKMIKLQIPQVVRVSLAQ